jgi:hypothetical protein
MQVAAYEAALDKTTKKARAYTRHGLTQPTMFTLTAIIKQYDEKRDLNAHEKITQKLLAIAQRMTTLLPGRQANIAELIACCEKLKVDLEAMPKFSAFQKIAEEFYTSHSNHGPFPSTELISVLKEEGSRDIISSSHESLSDVSFFRKKSLCPRPPTARPATSSTSILPQIHGHFARRLF